jgi:DNA-directed RNA polymerase subunit RPC12/RpoP
METYDTKYQDAPTCPHCGHHIRFAWEIVFGPGAEGEAEIECGECGKIFLASRQFRTTYSTQKLPNKGIAL